MRLHDDKTPPSAVMGPTRLLQGLPVIQRHSLIEGRAVSAIRRSEPGVRRPEPVGAPAPEGWGDFDFA